MSPRVSAAIAQILAFEGGIADVGDGRGVTRFGQTKDWLDDNGFIPPATIGDAADNYERWMGTTRISDVCDIDSTIGFLVADFAVHSGLSQAVKTLQALLLVPVDGVIGPMTLTALKARGLAPRAYWRARLRFIGELLGSQKTDRRRWAKGWISRLASIDETLV